MTSSELWKHRGDMQIYMEKVVRVIEMRKGGSSAKTGLFLVKALN